VYSLGNGSKKEKKLLAVQDDLAQRIIEIANRKGMTVYSFTNEILQQAIKADGMNQSLEDIVERFRLLEIERDSGAVFATTDTLLYMVEKLYQQEKRIFLRSGMNLENGVYEIKLRIVEGVYWDGFERVMVLLNMEVSNNVQVSNYFQALLEAVARVQGTVDDVQEVVDYLKPIIERIDENVVTIKTTVGIIKADVKDIIEDITIIKEDVAEIKTKVGTILGYVDDINWNDIITIKTDVGDIKVIVEGTEETVSGVSGLGINITAVLSAIAAIAAIISAVVVVRRLKVAA
jgi:hypothetical protein